MSLAPQTYELAKDRAIRYNKKRREEGSQRMNGKALELETLNKLYLELSQFVTAKTARELELEELLRSAHSIAERKGEDTAWERFAASLRDAGIGSVTARTYRVLPSDKP